LPTGTSKEWIKLLIFSLIVCFLFGANHDTFVLGRIFKATIFSKDVSFGRTCGNQEDFGPKRRRHEAISGEVAKNRSDSRKTT